MVIFPGNFRGVVWTPWTKPLPLSARRKAWASSIDEWAASLCMVPFCHCYMGPGIAWLDFCRTPCHLTRPVSVCRWTRRAIVSHGACIRTRPRNPRANPKQLVGHSLMTLCAARSCALPCARDAVRASEDACGSEVMFKPVLRASSSKNAQSQTWSYFIGFALACGFHARC